MNDATDVIDTRLGVADVQEKAGACWHVAQCQHGSDKHAQDQLTLHKFENYYPVVRTYRPVARRYMSRKERASLLVVKRPVIDALFPRYIFVRFDPAFDRWRDIFSFVGVTGLVCAGDQPVPLPDGVIEGLRAREHEGALPGQLPVAELKFALGETVRINAGSFSGFNGVIKRLPEARVEELDESARIALLVSCFGGMSTVDLRIGDIEKL